MSGIFDGDLVNAYRVSSSDFLKAKESDFLDIFKRWSIFEHVGWDVETGKPKEETLRKLGLDFVADEVC